MKYTFIKYLICALTFITYINLKGIKASPFIQPKANVVVENDQVVFEWSDRFEANTYTVEIFQTSNLNNILISSVSSNASIQLFNLPVGELSARLLTHFTNAKSDTSDFMELSVYDFNNESTTHFWLKADTGIELNGNNVVQWTNLVNEEQSFNQTNGGFAPVIKSNAINNLPSVRFDGLDDFLDAGSNFNLGRDGASLFLFAKSNVNTRSTFYAKALANSAPSRYALLYDGGSNLLSLYIDAANQSISIPNSNFGSFGLYNVVTNRANQTHTLFENGIALGQSSGIQDNQFNFSSGFRALIGGYNDASDQGILNPLNGEISEMLFLKGDYSTDEIQKINQYFVYKYTKTANLGPDLTLDPATCAVELSTTENFSTYLWSNGTTNETIIVTTPGTYSVTVTNELDFQTVDTIEVSFPNFNQPPDQYKLCIGDDLIWDATNPDVTAYNWSTGSTNPLININQPGNYQLTVTTTGGCSMVTESLTVEIDSFEFSDLITAQSDSLCSGDLISISNEVQGVNHLVWSTGDTTESIKIVEDGTFTITATDHFGCTATDTINISLKGALPSVDIESDTVCSGNVSTLTAVVEDINDIDSFLWMNQNLSIGSTQTIQFEFDQNKLFHSVSIEVINNAGCFSIQTDTIRTVRIPELSFQPDSSFVGCINAPIQFQSEVVLDSLDMIALSVFDIPELGISENGQIASITIQNAGVYNVVHTISTNRGCLINTTKPIVIENELPEPDRLSLIAPNNGAVLASNLSHLFEIDLGQFGQNYSIEFANNVAFSNPISFNLNANTFRLPPNTFENSGDFFWRIIAQNACGDQTISEVRSFQIINPNDFNTALWLVADSVVDNPSGVDKWSSIGNFPLDLVQTVSSQRPTLNQNGLNAHHTVLFDGGDDFLEAGDVLDQTLSGRTTFLVGKSNRLTNNCYWAKSLAANEANRVALNYSSNGVLRFLYQDEQLNLIDYETPEIGNFEILTTSVDLNQGIAALYSNGIERANQPTIQQNYLFDSDFRFLLGAYNNAQDNGEINQLEGEIAEFIIIDQTLSDFQRYLIEQYLRFKYAPQLNLGPDVYVDYSLCGAELSANHTFSDYQWSTGATSPTITVTETGYYSLTVTDLFGYPSVDSIYIEIPGFNIDSTVFICPNTDTILSSTSADGYVFNWSTGSTDSFEVFNTEGLYSVTVTDTNQCAQINSFEITVDAVQNTIDLGLDTSICLGDSITLKQGANLVQDYAWSSGETSSSIAPQNTGEYSVELTSFNGCLAYDTIQITIDGAIPEADFIASTACFGEPTQFGDFSTSSVGFITNWEWSFGDNNTSTLQNPTHTYGTQTEFEVTLRVEDNAGCTDETTQLVSVLPLPDISFSNFAPCLGETVELFGLGNSNLQNWQWTVNNQAPLSGRSINYTFDTAGEVRVLLSAESSSGCNNSFERIITVLPAPMPEIIEQQSCFGDSTILFDANSARDEVVEWNWDLGNFTQSVSDTVSVIYPNLGDYTVQLSVENAVGCITTTNKVITIETAPNAAGDFVVGCADFPLQLFDISEANVVSRTWIFNDSIIGSDSAITHQFPSAGEFEVDLLITTLAGCQDSTELIVEVTDGPTAAFTIDQPAGESPHQTGFSNNSTDANTYLWQFGNGAESSNFEPTVTYNEDGSYIISLVATDASGCSDTTIDSVLVAIQFLDLQLTDLRLQQLQQQQGDFVRLQVTVTLVNAGSTPVRSADLFINLDDAPTVSERWMGNLTLGQSVQYTFAGELILSQQQLNRFVCVKANNINALVFDDNPGNEELCENINGGIQVSQLKPTIADRQTNIQVVLKTSETIEVEVVDEQGSKVTAFTQAGLEGLNNVVIETINQNSGRYFVTITIGDQVYRRNYVVQR